MAFLDIGEQLNSKGSWNKFVLVNLNSSRSSAEARLDLDYHFRQRSSDVANMMVQELCESQGFLCVRSVTEQLHSWDRIREALEYPFYV